MTKEWGMGFILSGIHVITGRRVRRRRKGEWQQTRQRYDKSPAFKFARLELVCWVTVIYFAPWEEEKNGGSNANEAFLAFFWWSLAPGLRLSLGQTTTSCRRSVNISIIFSRLASIRENLYEKRYRKLLAMQWHKTLFDESGEEDASKLWRSEIQCCLCFRWLLDASQIQQLHARILTGLLCFAKIFVYKDTRNLMALISLQRKHGRRCQRTLKANDSSWHELAFWCRNNLSLFKTEADSGNFLAFAKAFFESWPKSRLLRFLFSR